MAEDMGSNVVLTADTSQFQSQMGAAEKSTQSVTDNVLALSSALGRLTSNTGRKIEIIGAGQMAAMTAFGVAAGNLESKMNQLQGTTKITGQNFDRMSKDVNSLRSSMGTTADSAVQLFTQLNKLGQSGTNMRQLAETFTRLQAVTGEGMSGLVDGLVSLQRQMGTMGSGYTEKFAANLAVLSQNAGVSASSVLQFSNAIAPVGRVAGMTTNEIMGVSTAFSKAGADGYSAANAFNKMLTDITRSIQYGSPELKAYSNLIGVSVDQFKQMPKTEAVTRIFEEINKQGPDAIKTLERFGLDGVRTFRSIQAVAAGGDLRAQVANVIDPNNSEKFLAASDDAMDGLNDSMNKLKSSSEQVAEAMGKGFLPVLKAVADAANTVLSPIKGILQLLGNLPGIAGGASAAMTMLAGGGLMMLPKLFAASSAMQFIRSPFTQGLAHGWSGTPNSGTARYNNVDDQGRHTAGALQRGTYWLGKNLAGGVATTQQAIFGQGTGPGPSGLGQAAGYAVRGLGSVVRWGLDPLKPSNVWNPFNRTPLFPSASSAGAWWDKTVHGIQDQRGIRQGAARNFRDHLMERAPRNRLGSMIVSDQMKGAAAYRLEQAHIAAAAAAGRQAAASNTAAGAFRSLAMETGKLSVAMLKATGGGALGVGMAGARLAGTGVGKAIGAIGGMNLALIGGMWGMSKRSEEQDVSQRLANSTEDKAAGAAYRQALGEAATATMSFAEAVKQAAQAAKNESGERLTLGKALNVTSEDLRKVQDSAADYSDKQMAGMSQSEATAYASNALIGASPQQGMLLRNDLLKRFGDVGTVRSILSDAQTNPGQTGPLWDRITKEQSSGVHTVLNWANADFWTSKGAEDAALTASSTAKAAIQRAPEGQRQHVMAGVFNEALNSVQNSKDEQSWGTISDSLAGTLGAGDDKSRKAMYEAIRSARLRMKDGKLDHNQVIDDIAASDTDAGTLMKGLQGYAKRNNISLTSMITGPAQTDQSGLLDASQYKSTRVGGTSLGNMIMGDKGDLQYAYKNEADANAQHDASVMMVRRMVSTTGSLEGAISAIQDLRNAGIATTDRLYQMAAGAEAYARKLQQESMAYMTQGQQATVLNTNYRQSAAIAANNPSDELAQQTFEQDRDAREQARQGAYQKAKGILYSIREQGVARQRGLESMSRQEGYGRSDMARSMAFGQEDFDRQRKRSEEEYARQLKYTLADYNRNRMWSEQAYQRSRRRSEEDYNHQVVQMAKQAAKQVYDIYERVNVQRTMSAQALMLNMMDQQRRMEEQQSQLGKLRGMGLSGDVISMLGLNEAQGAQQLGRFLDDVMADPALIQKYNEAAKKRTAAAGKIVTDKDSEQWKEMQRSHNLQRDRSDQDYETSLSQQATTFREGLRRQREGYDRQMTQGEQDFKRARDRQIAQFGIQMERMRDEFAIQQNHAREDLARSATEIEGKFGDVMDKAIAALSGGARKQMQVLRTELSNAGDEVKKSTGELVMSLAELFDKVGIKIDTSGVARGSTGGRRTTGTIVVNGQRTNAGQMADGGLVGGQSLHSREDNIPTMLTANEYVQPVDTVLHYGKDAMEAIRKRKVPKDIFRHYANGGLVEFGHSLQHRGYDVSEHPLFGGVHPVHTKGSWHYKAGAIDVNADNFREGEKAAIDKIVGEARRYGLRTIWQSPGHFDHAHFDIGAGKDLVGSGYSPTSGPGGQVSGVTYIELLRKIQGLAAMKRFDRAMAMSGPTKQLGNGWLAKELADTYGNKAQSYSTIADGPVKQMAQQMAALKGWTGGQWDSLNWIVNKESGWNPKAQNPTSTAYGLFQFLDQTWSAMGGTKTSDPRKQIELGLKYIDTRYDNPKRAQDFWKAHNWYGEGSVFTGPAKIGVGERGPEAVFPLNEKGAAFLVSLMRKYSGNTDYARANHAQGSSPVPSQQVVNYYSRVDKSNNFHGAIHVEANDPNKFIKQLEAKQRMSALTGGRG